MHAIVKFVATATLAAGTAAWADLDVVVANGDLVRGSLLPATQTETFRVRCPAGARLAVKLRTARGRARLLVHVLDAADVDLGSAAGRRIALRGIAVAESGEVRMEVSTADGLTSGDYRLGVRWKSPRRAKETENLAAGGTGTLSFAADAGAAVRLRVAPGPGSDAAPALLRLEGPDGFTVALPSEGETSVVVPSAGTYAVTFENTAAAAGDVVASASIRAPRVRTRRLAATTAEIPAGTDVLAAGVIGAGGGSVEVSGGALDGATVTVPAGALASAAIVVVGTAGDLAPPKPADSTLATPAAFVGPVGTAFPGAARPRVALPVRAVLGLPASAGLRVFAARTVGAVDVVEGAEYDGVDVEFEPARLTAFQGWFVDQPDIAPPFVGEDAGERPLGAVAVGGGYAFVGSPYGAYDPRLPPSLGAGRVLVYQRAGATWALRQTLEAPVPAEADLFGSAVVVRRSPLGPPDDSLLVSADQHVSSGIVRPGKIHEYVLADGRWVFRTTITSGAQGEDGFGATLDADGDRLVVPMAGRILVLGRSATGWSLSADVAAPTWAGSRIDFDQGTILVGVESDWSVTTYHPPGSAYRYEPSGATWTQALRYSAPPPEQDRNAYGIAVALGNSYVAAAMPNAGGTGAAGRPVDVLVHGRGGGELDATIVAPIDPRLGSRSPHLTGEMQFRGDDLFLAARSDSEFAGAYEFRRTDGAWQRSRTFDAGPYVDVDSRSLPLTGDLAVDGTTLAFTVGIYDIDLRTTRYAVVIFEAP